MSEQYIVSARKYRPQTFDTVLGQEHITTTLKNAMRTQHLAHAFLFCGPRGVGKTTCARILAKTLNCTQPTADMEACGHCDNCVSFANNTSFNVFELDAASNNSVDDIRNLTEQVRFAPQQGKFKVYIIDEVHMLSTAAFNAFLKTLEEPPPYAIFILATTEKHKILPTILSRCQIFDFKRITTNDTVQHLAKITQNENIVAEEAALHVIAQKSEGCMRDALSMLDRISSFTNGQLSYAATMEHLNQLDADFYFKLTDLLLCSDVAGTLLLLDEILDRGFEGDVLLDGLAAHFRNLLLCKDARMAKLLDVPNNFKPIYHEKAAQTPPSFIISALNAVNDSAIEYKNTNNKRLHTEMCLIRLCYLLQATQMGKTIAAEEEKKKSNFEATHKIEQSIVGNTLEGNNAAMQPSTQEESKQAEYPKPVETIRPLEQSAQATSTQSVPQQVIAAQPTPAQHNSTPTTATGTGRRISRNMLQQMGNVTNDVPKINIQDLTLEKVLEFIESFKLQLKNEQKSVVFNAFSNINIQMPEQGVIHCIAPNSITDGYIASEKGNLQELIKKETGLMVSIINSFVETQEEPRERILTKSELFGLMAEKNPEVLALAEKLKLSLEK